MDRSAIDSNKITKIPIKLELKLFYKPVGNGIINSLVKLFLHKFKDFLQELKKILDIYLC